MMERKVTGGICLRRLCLGALVRRLMHFGVERKRPRSIVATMSVVGRFAWIGEISACGVDQRSVRRRNLRRSCRIRMGGRHAVGTEDMVRMKRSVAAVAMVPHRPAGVHGRGDEVVAHRAEVLHRGGEDLNFRDPVVLSGKGTACGDGSGGGLSNMENPGGDRRLAAGAERDVGDEVPEPRRGHVAVFVVVCRLLTCERKVNG